VNLLNLKNQKSQRRKRRIRRAPKLMVELKAEMSTQKQVLPEDLERVMVD